MSKSRGDVKWRPSDFPSQQLSSKHSENVNIHKADQMNIQEAKGIKPRKFGTQIQSGSDTPNFQTL